MPHVCGAAIEAGLSGFLVLLLVVCSVSPAVCVDLGVPGGAQQMLSSIFLLHCVNRIPGRLLDRSRAAQGRSRLLGPKCSLTYFGVNPLHFLQQWEHKNTGAPG